MLMTYHGKYMVPVNLVPSDCMHVDIYHAECSEDSEVLLMENGPISHFTQKIVNAACYILITQSQFLQGSQIK